MTGPSRILIEFAKRARNPEPGWPAVQMTIASYERGGRENPIVTAAKAEGLRAYTIPERRRFDVAVMPRLKRLIAEVQPDILETRNIKSHFFVRMLGLHRRYVWVAWNHGYTNKNWLDRTYNRLDRWSLPAAYRMMTMCQPFADRLVEAGVSRSKITILHNFMKPFVVPEAEEVQRVRESLGLSGELVVLSVGRLSNEKGHADLLHAIAALSRQTDVPAYRVVLVGDGPEQQNLQQLALRLGIEKRLVFAGFQRNVNPYYSLATIFALPSHSEGSPNVVLEAMSVGLPIAATAVGGVPEILQNEVTGLLVPAGDAHAMSEALGRLLMDDGLRQRLGEQAKAHVTTNYTFESYRRSLVRFYMDVLESRGGSPAEISTINAAEANHLH